MIWTAAIAIGAVLGALTTFSTFSAEIVALLLYAGIHQQVFGYHRTLLRRFP